MSWVICMLWLTRNVPLTTSSRHTVLERKYWGPQVTSAHLPIKKISALNLMLVEGGGHWWWTIILSTPFLGPHTCSYFEMQHKSKAKVPHAHVISMASMFMHTALLFWPGGYKWCTSFRTFEKWNVQKVYLLCPPGNADYNTITEKYFSHS